MLPLPKIFIVINQSERETSNIFCNSIGAQGDTFNVALFDSINEIAGFWCGWLVDDSQFEHIQSYFKNIFNSPGDALSFCGWHPANSPNEFQKQNYILAVKNSESLE